MIATTIISSMRVKPCAREPRACRMFRSIAIVDQLPPGDSPHRGLGAAGLVLSVSAVVQARIHVRAEEDRVVRTAVVGHARVRRRGVAVLVVAAVADGPRLVDVEERAVEPATGER